MLSGEPVTWQYVFRFGFLALLILAIVVACADYARFKRGD